MADVFVESQDPWNLFNHQNGIKLKRSILTRKKIKTKIEEIQNLAELKSTSATECGFGDYAAFVALWPYMTVLQTNEIFLARSKTLGKIVKCDGKEENIKGKRSQKAKSSFNRHMPNLI